jgi:hypothetical protein
MSPNTMALTPYGSNGSTDLTMAVLGCGKSTEIPLAPDANRRFLEDGVLYFCGCFNTQLSSANKSKEPWALLFSAVS